MQKFNAELLISSVQFRPLLWQDKLPNYKNKLITDKLWNEVGEICGCTGAVAKIKWKNLKDKYRKTVQNLPRARSGSEAHKIKITWLHFEMMGFIRDTVVPDPTEGNLPERDSVNDSLSRLVEDLLSEEDYTYQNMGQEDLTQTNENIATICSASTFSATCSTPVQPKKIKRSATSNLDENFLNLEKERLVILKNELQKTEDNADLQFFKSLLPFMAKLNDVDKLIIQGEMQNLILNKIKSYETA